MENDMPERVVVELEEIAARLPTDTRYRDSFEDELIDVWLGPVRLALGNPCCCVSDTAGRRCRVEFRRDAAARVAAWCEEHADILHHIPDEGEREQAAVLRRAAARFRSSLPPCVA